MKKIQFTLAALMFVFAACNTQEFVPSEGSSEEGKLTTVTIKASNGDADTKAAISNDLTFTWTAGDQIAVHTDAGQFYTSDELAIGGTTADFTVSLSGNRNGYAVYPASVAKSWSESTLTLTLPNTYTYAQVSGDNTPLPMIADNTVATLNFYHVAGLLRLTITNIPTGTNKIKLDFNGMKVSGDFTISSPSAGSSSIGSVPGTKGTNDIIWITGITGTEDLTVNIPLPTGATYSDLVVSAWNDDAALRGQVVAFNTYSPARARGKKLSAALNLGAVSIASGKYAVFAPGNLQATISTVDGEGTPTAATWAFNTYQYGYLGESQTSFSVGSTIDLFTWVGNSSAVTGLEAYGILDGTTKDYGNVGSETLKSDWGGNLISYKGNTYASGTWRTPTSYSNVDFTNVGELQWLLGPNLGTSISANPGTNCRASSTVNEVTNARFAFSSINGVKGLIIFPDNYTHPTSLSSHQIARINSAYQSDWSDFSEDFSLEEWALIEAAGAIFLPCAGARDPGMSIGLVGTRGFYWANKGGPNDTYARYVLLNPNGGLNQSLPRYEGFSVRLIRDLN